MKKLLIAYLICSVGSLCAAERAKNPFIKHMLTADPTARVWEDGRLYVYPSTDIKGKGYRSMDGYHVFSTDDMLDWKDHGEILHSRDVDWSDVSGAMWAPDCVYKDGIYYFYFPHTNNDGEWEVGIATSTKPASDFKVQGFVKGATTYCDPCVFLDDDGQAYLYAVVKKKCYAVKLKSNMKEIDGEWALQELEDHREGPFVFKRNGTYYLMYPDNAKDGHQMRYAMSQSPLGPWDCKGVFLEKTTSYTTHGSVVEYKGKWYLFYHSCDLSGGKSTNRSICFDEVTFNDDGTIQLVQQTRDITMQKGGNPIIQHMYTADPSAHVWADGKMWIYPSHDQNDATSYGSMNGHHVFSSPDLVNWTDHGEIMHTDDIRWAKKGHLWAPDCAYKDGTYYYYYPARDKANKNRVGVATSTSPSGPFTDSGAYIEGTDEIDPACFVDDDGQAYLYWGGHRDPVRMAKLNDDMKTLGEVKQVTLPEFYEAPWIHKRNGIYYLSYATGTHAPIAYATSTSPMGPFTYQGVLMDKVPNCVTNHHSIVKFKGRWYIFYHSVALSGRSHRRSVCVDYLYHNEDGSIKKVVQTKEGVSPVPFNAALNKKAVQSSTEFGAEAGRAVDGNTSSMRNDASVACTGDEATAWWQVDLEEDFLIDEIKIWNQEGPGGAKLTEYTISVFDEYQDVVWSSQQTSSAKRPTSVYVGGKVGRTVKIQLAGTGALSLAEVEVLSTSIPLPKIPMNPNVAKGKPATQSSTKLRASASRAVDGNTNGAFFDGSVTHTGDDEQAWWQVDLEADYEIGDINVWNRSDKSSIGRLSDYKVTILDADQKEVWSNHQTKQAGFPTTVNAGGAEGRYVKVQLMSGNNGLCLAEVQVFSNSSD
ncbi:Xylosidase/arabinosidase [Novipirellula aureliae]|uniref:Xylosidase/arabinosidase n=1 Tax=Novipirellula aureliae TaxID=2527966 RepID=A0A5C6DM88_9BACT|nr:family 43 glycosylhydrolase [Novipirellula aureliae]TWU37918.1 Xylosidase/arabinosidase [Novipirellula aureliae]